MPNSAIELHDSLLTDVRTDDEGQVVLDLEAYVHVSDGEPAIDPGAGWIRPVRMMVYEGTTSGSFDGMALRILDGAITIGAQKYENLAPLVLDETAKIEITLGLGDGSVLSVTGTRLTIEPAGEGRLVEESLGSG